MQTYVLTAGQPVRAAGISAVVDLVGAVLLVLGLTHDSVLLIVIGAVLFAAGTALVAAATVLRRQVRTEARLDDDQIMITAGGRTATARWREITAVTSDRRAIFLSRGEDRPALKIDSPRGHADPQFAALAAELARRLDQDRGYRPL